MRFEFQRYRLCTQFIYRKFSTNNLFVHTTQTLNNHRSYSQCMRAEQHANVFIVCAVGDKCGELCFPFFLFSFIWFWLSFINSLAAAIYWIETSSLIRYVITETKGRDVCDTVIVLLICSKSLRTPKTFAAFFRSATKHLKFDEIPMGQWNGTFIKKINLKMNKINARGLPPNQRTTKKTSRPHSPPNIIWYIRRCNFCGTQINLFFCWRKRSNLDAKKVISGSANDQSNLYLQQFILWNICVNLLPFRFIRDSIVRQMYNFHFHSDDRTRM